MIIELLLNVLYNFLRVILSLISLPGTPEEFQTNLNTFVNMLSYGKSFLPLFIPIDVTYYVVLAVGLFAFEHLYAPIRWIINKVIEIIP